MINEFKLRKARKVVSYLALLLFSDKCSQPVNYNQDYKFGYSILINWDLISPEEGNVIKLLDTFTIISRGNVCMYIIPKPYQKSYVTYNKDDSLINEKIETGTNYNYYLFNKAKQKGLKYDSINADKGTGFLVDSLIQSKNFFKSDINLDSNYLLIKRDLNKNIEREIYWYRNKSEENPDSIYLTFSSDYNNASYYFSKKLDSIHQKKLCKIQMIYNPLKSEKYSFLVPKRELLFEIKKTAIEDHYNVLFKRFDESNLD